VLRGKYATKVKKTIVLRIFKTLKTHFPSNAKRFRRLKRICRELINATRGWCFRFGRRRSLIAYHAISGVALILSLVIPQQAGEPINVSPVKVHVYGGVPCHCPGTASGVNKP